MKREYFQQGRFDCDQIKCIYYRFLGKSQGPSPAVQNMSISFTNNKSGQSTRTVTTTSPPRKHTSAVLEDPAVVKWIKVVSFLVNLSG